MLTSLARITFEDTVLVKTHLVKYPYKCLTGVYLFCIIVLAYVVYSCERCTGQEFVYGDAVWLMVVSITNLGFGDVVPLSIGGRTFVGLASMLGVLIAALWISAMRELLEIPLTEKRLLAAVRKARFRRIKIEAACRCIQTAWRYHRYKKVETDPTKSLNGLGRAGNMLGAMHVQGQNLSQTQNNQNKPGIKKKSTSYCERILEKKSSFLFTGKQSINAISLGGRSVKNHISKSQVAERFHRALWNWKKIRSLNSDRFFTDFTLEDTHNLTRGLEKKLNNIEKYMSENSNGQFQGEPFSNNSTSVEPKSPLGNFGQEGPSFFANNFDSHGTRINSSYSTGAKKRLNSSKSTNSKRTAKAQNKDFLHVSDAQGWAKLREINSRGSLRASLVSPDNNSNVFVDSESIKNIIRPETALINTTAIPPSGHITPFSTNPHQILPPLPTTPINININLDINNSNKNFSDNDMVDASRDASKNDELQEILDQKNQEKETDTKLKQLNDELQKINSRQVELIHQIGQLQPSENQDALQANSLTQQQLMYVSIINLLKPLTVTTPSKKTEK